MSDLSRTTTAFLTLLLPVVGLATPAADGQEMKLNGMLRDFRPDHDDFNVSASSGFGHYAGTVDYVMGDAFTPMLGGSGYYVMEEWQDAYENNIAPHLQTNNADLNGPLFLVNGAVDIQQGALDSLGSAGGAILVTNSIAPASVTLMNNAVLNGDLYVGAGGSPSNICNISGNSAITGDVSVLSTPITMPVVTEPEAMPSSLGNVLFDWTTLDHDLHVNTLTIEHNHTVTISGDVRILVDGDFVMLNQSRIKLAPNATLELCVKGDVQLQSNASINAGSQDPALFLFKVIGAQDIHLENKNHVYGTLQASDCTLTMENNGLLAGSLAVETLAINNNAVGSSGDGSAALGCGIFDDEEGVAGVGSTGGISSSASFEQWFKDIVGVNLSAWHSITLLRDAAGVYEFLSDEFFPADGRLFGNEGSDHNDFFTYEVRAWGEFEACAGQFIEFQGGDGFWLFINGAMVLDLGGVQGNEIQLIELDRLTLADGETVDVHLSYANRNAAGSVFRLRTNMELTTAFSDASASAVFD
jgi:fibro-slime domain-containing protein